MTPTTMTTTIPALSLSRSIDDTVFDLANDCLAEATTLGKLTATAIDAEEELTTTQEALLLRQAELLTTDPPLITGRNEQQRQAELQVRCHDELETITTARQAFTIAKAAKARAEARLKGHQLQAQLLSAYLGALAHQPPTTG